jgi:hypothetical protein
MPGDPDCVLTVSLLPILIVRVEHARALSSSFSRIAARN